MPASLVRLYLRRPGLVTIALSALALGVLWHGPLLGTVVMPYDFQSADYPTFIDAVRAAKFDPFSVYNPFNDAGQITSNLFATYDPLAWLAVVSPGYPGYSALALYYLAHLLLIPVGLVLVAWANDVPRQRWIAIVPLSLVAFAMGPTLKYVQQTNSLVALGCLVMLFGALEAFRRTGAPWAALLAGLMLAYTNEQWVYAAVFVPIPLAAYAIVNARALFSSRGRVIALVAGAALAILVTLPALLLDVKLDQTIEVARHLEQLPELRPADALSMLGAPSSALALVAIPSALLALVILAFRRMTPWERRVYGAAMLVLVLYGFAELTPFAAIFRKIYLPAGFIRRPYSAWYVIVPLMLFLATRSLATWSPRTVQAATLLSAVGLGIACLQGTSWAAALVVGAALAVTFWRPILPVLLAAMIAQWAVIDWIPFERSTWHPQPIAPAGAYFAPYETLRPILPFESSSSARGYRVANVGLPAEFGPSAGAFAVYDVAADYNTFFSHELVTELGTDQLHAVDLLPYFQAHPDALGGTPWERLAVRYYLFGPPEFSALQPVIRANAHLRVVPVESYWKVVEDTHAAPFVAAVADDGASASVDAAMTRDSFTLTVPPRASTIRFAQVYDPWWHAFAGGTDVSSAVRDDGGQLALDARALRGRTVTLRFSSRRTTLALALALAAQLAVGVFFVALAVRAALRWRRRRAAPAT
jgi:hypothetical protein